MAATPKKQTPHPKQRVAPHRERLRAAVATGAVFDAMLVVIACHP
jgi:hypothetical protein